MPPSAEPEWLRVGCSFETIATSAPARGLDRGAHACAACADHDHVVLRVHPLKDATRIAVADAPLQIDDSVGGPGREAAPSGIFARQASALRMPVLRG